MDPLVVFDLDDTLYLERDFVMSGYRAVAEWLGRHRGVHGFEATCAALFEAGQRLNVFDRALERHGFDEDPFLVRQLVEIYRGHPPRITLAPDAACYLATMRASQPWALITDGPLATQRAKIAALGLDRVIDYPLCTAALGSGCGKPHHKAFEMVESWAGGWGRRLVYVADNPAKDFVAPRARGWLTVRIRRPGAVHDVAAPDPLHEADAEIVSLDELDACLARLSGGGLSLKGQAIPVEHPGGAFVQAAP